MEGLIAFIVIIIALSVSAGKSKKAMKNLPGKQNAARPASSVKPAAPQTAPVQPVRPVAPPPQVLDASDYARADLDEGDSRACDHGSVGGSMDITDHAGMGDEFVHAKQTVKTTVATSVKTQVKVNRDDMPSEAETETGEAEEEAAPKKSADFVRSAAASMDAERMRQAVVMAEILKRPSERFGRWPAR